MWPDRVSNPGPLTYESGVLPTALRDPAILLSITNRPYGHKTELNTSGWCLVPFCGRKVCLYLLHRVLHFGGYGNGNNDNNIHSVITSMYSS